MLPMLKLLKMFQGTILNMWLTNRLTEREFNVLSVLSEAMTTDENALEIAFKLTPDDLQSHNLIGHILTKNFITARAMIEDGKCPWD